MSTTWTAKIKPGQGWAYNQPQVTYNGTYDPINSMIVYYNLLGSATVWTDTNKP